MLNYRWPGYAFEDGILYATSGPDRGNASRLHWHRVTSLSDRALKGLLLQLESEIEHAPFDFMPSQGIIHNSGRGKDL